MDELLLKELQVMLDHFNTYAHKFCRVQDIYGHTPPLELTMRILDTRASNGSQYNFPQLMKYQLYCLTEDIMKDRDIVLCTFGGQLR